MSAILTTIAAALTASTAAAAKPANVAPPPRAHAEAAGDFLASRRVPIGRTRFDGQWNRVRDATLAGHSDVGSRAMADAHGERLLQLVNAYANRRIRHVGDDLLYGRADYWATAATTLDRGAGDCEDIAIAKMQLLAAHRVPPAAMFLTIVRDLRRGADHAVLIVELAGRLWLLDNRSDGLVDARTATGYRPYLSFSGDRRWLHGLARPGSSAAGARAEFPVPGSPDRPIAPSP